MTASQPSPARRGQAQFQLGIPIERATTRSSIIERETTQQHAARHRRILASSADTMRPGYRFCRFLCQVFCGLYLKTRVFGLPNVPRHGGVLLVANHQSFMDPVLSTMALHREGDFMARDSLFGNPHFKNLIEYLNAFPIRRNTADLGAIKEALRRLKSGRLLVLFPEGTRTEDGRIHPFLPGMGAIARKARVPIVPTLIDGMYQAWPKGQRFPSPADVIIEYGQAIQPHAYADLSIEDLMALIRDRLVTMQLRWHGRLPQRRLEWFTSAKTSSRAVRGEPVGS